MCVCVCFANALPLVYDIGVLNITEYFAYVDALFMQDNECSFTSNLKGVMQQENVLSC